MECRDNSRAKVAGWTGPTRWLAGLAVLLLVASLPTAAQSRKAIEKELRKEFGGRIWLLDPGQVPRDLKVAVPRRERWLFGAGAPLLLHVQRIWIVKGKIQLSAQRVIPFRVAGEKPAGIRSRIGRYTFSTRLQKISPAALVAEFRKALTPGAAVMEKAKRNWIESPLELPKSPKVGEEERSSGVARIYYQTGGGVTAPMCVECPAPEFTSGARQEKRSGVVVLWTIITAGGWASDMVVVKSAGHNIDEQAVLAVSRWKFKPGTKDGKPVATATTIEINFSIY